MNERRNRPPALPRESGASQDVTVDYGARVRMDAERITQQDDPFLKYFDSEMRYLREAGREFAEAQPQAARQLG